MRELLTRGVDVMGALGRTGRGVRAALVTLALVGASVAGLAQAATISVTTTDDEVSPNGLCSLREAILAANTDTAVDTCPAGSSTSVDTILLPAGTFGIVGNALDDDGLSGDLDITGRLNISGSTAGGSTITGLITSSIFQDRVLHIHAGAVVRLDNLTITGGFNDSPDPAGGGILNEGSLTISRTTVSGNLSRSAGGGIANGGSLIILDSTISSNTADAEFGEGGGIQNFGTLVVFDSTIANNQVGLDSPTDIVFAHGGGIASRSASTTLRNTIVVGNRTLGSASDPRFAPTGHDCDTQIQSRGHNLVGSCPLSGDTTGDIVLTSDPRQFVPLDAAGLGLLRNNGGPTFTHALLAGSLAIDAGVPEAAGSNSAGCPPFDQRGVPRPQDGNGDGTAVCDIGAFELRPG